MNIRKIKKNEIKELIPLYREAFPVHNIFRKSDEDIFDYLKDKKNGLVVATEEGKIIGAAFYAQRVYNNSHKLARIKHLAVYQKYRGKGVGKELMRYIESLIGKAKIEIKVNETEKEFISFYESRGYAVEGRLKDHFRPNEACFVLGKYKTI